MKRHPRRRSERITDRRFLRTMGLTGFLTAGVAFAVYLYVPEDGNPGNGPHLRLRRAGLRRTPALLRRPQRDQARLAHPLFTNINLVIVVAVSFGLQVWSQHNATLGRFLKTSSMPFADCLWLLALGSIPLLVLEMVKLVGTEDTARRSRRRVGLYTP